MNTSCSPLTCACRVRSACLVRYSVLTTSLFLLFLFPAQLEALGVSSDNVAFNTCTMESEKYICIRDEKKKEVIIVEVVSWAQPLARKE